TMEEWAVRVTWEGEYPRRCHIL
ncbi:MAG: hypothetical protein EZS28_041107, partial [Streblomastix strix]